MFIKINNVYIDLFCVKECSSLLFTYGHYIVYNKRNLLLVFKACT